MRLSIRSKFVFAISLLMVVLFSLVALLFISEKKTEIAGDIYGNGLAFARLTAPTVVSNYDLYLAQNGFVFFNREMQKIFEQNDDIDRVQVISYVGEILYDSAVDVDRQHEGKSRFVKDEELFGQVRSENNSVRVLDSGETYYIKRLDDGGMKYVDKQERELEAFENGTLMEYLVIPASEKYAVVYYFNYHNLNERVEMMMSRIGYMALFAIMLGMLLSFVMSSHVTKPVAKLVEGAENIAKGNFKTRVDIESHDEIGYLGQAFNKMAIDLEESMEARLYKERVTHELELAIEIQDQIIPDQEEIPQPEGLEISAGIISAEEIGGDMYDFLRVGEDKTLMYLGDVTGHGVPAGIISSIASALFYGFSPQGDIKRILVEVNRVLKAKTMPTMFMTLCLMEWVDGGSELKYVNAGHEQLIHYKAREKKAELRPAGGIALGMLPNVEQHLKVDSIALEPGDFIVVYSDGIPEAWKSHEEYYGIERLIKTVEKFGDSPDAMSLQHSILEDVKAYANGYRQMDDITIMVLRRV